jgi:hypothetical protein
MKEIAIIIEKMHEINQQIVEKDNLLDKMQPLVDLMTQLIKDPDFTKSDIYLDLRIKYLIQIEEKLNTLNQSSITVTIEPENIIKSTNSKDICKDKSKDKKKVKSQFTKDDVKAPLKTDIYMAPSCRSSFKRKKNKKEEGSEKDVVSDKDAGSDKDVGSVKKTGSKESYISFEYDGEQYLIYLDGRPRDHFDIYDCQLAIAGEVRGSIITLIKGDEIMDTITINLSTSDQKPDGVEFLFGQYFIDHI